MIPVAPPECALPRPPLGTAVLPLYLYACFVVDL
jgi:hypothetical protein